MEVMVAKFNNYPSQKASIRNKVVSIFNFPTKLHSCRLKLVKFRFSSKLKTAGRTAMNNIKSVPFL